jgi:hypothetical protein
MRETNIAETAVDLVAARLKHLSPNITPIVASEWGRPPAATVIECVLQINRNYNKMVLPRLKVFEEKHPKTQRVTELAKLIDNYPTSHVFVKKELNYNHEDRARILESVVRYVCTIVEGVQTLEKEKESLKYWVIRSKPQDYQTLNIRGFGLASFQFLRLAFGAQTVKPDVHVRNFLSKTLMRNVSAIQSVLLLEAASKQVGLSVRDVDNFIWKRGLGN